MRATKCISSRHIIWFFCALVRRNSVVILYFYASKNLLLLMATVDCLILVLLYPHADPVSRLQVSRFAMGVFQAEPLQ